MSTDPIHNQPLTLWGQVWRIGVVLAFSIGASVTLLSSQWAQHRGLVALDLTLGVIAFVLMFWRRRYPFAVAMATTLMGVASVSVAGPGLLAFMSLATRRKLTRILPVAVAGVVAGQVFYFYQPGSGTDGPWVNLTWLVIATIAMAAIGMYIGSRRELLWTLRERARVAESEQELRVSQARSAERENIAREMHDVLAHRISLVSMHAGALSYRTDLDQDQVRETADLINATSQEALADLRGVLGALRADQAARPQPGFTDIDDLVADSGQRVELEQLVRDPVPDRIGRTAYRIIQEGLTNARKHAPTEIVVVSLAGAPENGLTVTISNRQPEHRSSAGGTGLGLVGMRERVELAGGRLVVRETAGRFALEAWLPWPL